MKSPTELANEARAWMVGSAKCRPDSSPMVALAELEARANEAEKDAREADEDRNHVHARNLTVERERDEAVARAEAAERRAEQAEAALRTVRGVVDAWDNDETPDADFPFNSDMDFLMYVGHIARAGTGPV